MNKTKERPVPLDRGRTVFFYVDDFHLDLSGANAARKVITRFIDAEMSENDEAVITSASGTAGIPPATDQQQDSVATGARTAEPATVHGAGHAAPGDDGVSSAANR